MKLLGREESLGPLDGGYREPTQSPVYTKQSRGGARTASVRIVSGGSQISGFITMTQADASSPVYVKGEVRGLRAGPHGFHIHEIGNTDGELDGDAMIDFEYVRWYSY